MATYTRISEAEQAQIKTPISQGVSYFEIARNLKGYISSITCFVICEKKEEIRFQTRPKPKKFDRMQHCIVNTAQRCKQVHMKKKTI